MKNIIRTCLHRASLQRSRIHKKRLRNLLREALKKSHYLNSKLIPAYGGRVRLCNFLKLSWDYGHNFVLIVVIFLQSNSRCIVTPLTGVSSGTLEDGDKSTFHMECSAYDLESDGQPTDAVPA